MWPRKRLKRLFSSGRRLIPLGLVIIFGLLLIAFFVSNSSNKGGRLPSTDSQGEHEQCCDCDGWRSHFVVSEEEDRVFRSVRKEHIDLLRKLDEVRFKLDNVSMEISLKEAELRELEMRVDMLKLLRKEYSDRRNVQLKLPNAPLKLMMKNESDDKENAIGNSINSHLLEDNFDFSRCSISNPTMPMFIYPLNSNHSALAAQFYKELFGGQQLASITSDPNESCLFMAIIDVGTEYNELYNSFKHFGIGRNHLLLDLSGNLRPNQIKASLLISSGITSKNYRSSMDIAVHLMVPESDPNRWKSLPALLPVSRKYFIRFVANPELLNPTQLTELNELRKSMDSSQDTYLIDLDCPFNRNSNLCYGSKERFRMGQQSLFTILFPELPSFQQHFYDSLETGSIPVVCSLHVPLPFDGFIDWQQAALRVSSSRLPELHFILRSISTADLIELKRKGRFYFENYLADSKILVRTILSVMQVRLQLPGREYSEPTALPLYESANWTYPSFISTATKPPYDDEYLGPIEIPIESSSFAHNFTSLSMYSGRLFNEFPMALGHSSRFLPFSHFLPSDAEFHDDTAFGMRPILPGSGQEFALALGGNRPREQFTIVIVTYNREQVLLSTLERLNNLPYLNRIIIVWNDFQRAPSVSAWPRLHVPVLFVNGTKNSLNNRFLPYKEIETEAILSMDDDLDLKQFEIIFAFRIWRENRDRIVGFPARYHARFDGDNYYNSNHTCQYSMILTGAAFIHKFYLHAYTYHMPEIIRQKVDEWMNCEDLAMNFLVAHLTRKAPIKTTSKWTLRCPTCPEMLSNDEEHFVERHDCIRFFIRVYGYNPLVFSQFRADSVLFKTRVPSNHQKCFRYV